MSDADKAGQGASGFRALMRGLPDAIGRARDRGQPIRMPDPGTEHGRRLYEALGVELEEPSTPAQPPTLRP